MNPITSFVQGATLTHQGARLDLISPVDLSLTGHIIEADAAVVDQAVRAAHAAYREHRHSTLLQRVGWLNAAAQAIEAASEEIIELLIRDVGKPRKAATFEVRRSAQFLRSTATTVVTMRGESIPLDNVENGARHFGFTRHVPYGVVGAITPFNAPINLLIQKVAPALAAGNSVVVKPHLAGTRVALRVAEIFAQAGLPADLFNVVTGDRIPAAELAAHTLVDAVTFTGGTVAGDALARAAGAKKFIAELGSNAANVVLADADIEVAARKIAGAAFEASGQQCISAQRVIVAEAVYQPFLKAFVEAASKLKMGDPAKPDTDLGPMISAQAARRVHDMVHDSVAQGAQWALRPTFDNCYVSPGILTGAPFTSPVWTDEAFGPVAVVSSASSVSDALEQANDSPFGLQGALFTQSLDAVTRFADDFEVGSFWVNEPTRFRLDDYPFGGAKKSGYGREGVRYAIEEMSQIKFVGILKG